MYLDEIKYVNCYSKSTESGNQQNSCVWSKISYRIFLSDSIKIYIENLYIEIYKMVWKSKENNFS